MEGNWAKAIEALGAGLQGRGTEYMLAETARKKEEQELSLERKKAWILDMDQAVSLAEAGDVGGAQALLQNRIENVDRLNGDPQHSAGMLRLLQEGKVDEFVAGAKPIVERGKVEFGLNGPDEPANVREYKYYASLTPEQQAQYREMKRAQQLIETGGGAQAVVGGGVATPITTAPGQTVDQFRAEYAGAEANLEGSKQGAKTAAKLATEFALSPKVEAAVKAAVSQVDSMATQAQEGRSNDRALAVYETAMNGLAESMHDTETGPFVGWIPAITENSQKASGAIAAMAPVLKGIFRAAGEGTFTDKDQEMLLEMVPTRKDKPAARLWKLENIDAIVRAKLGSESTGPSMTDIEYTAKKYGMTVEQVKQKLGMQ